MWVIKKWINKASSINNINGDAIDTPESSGICRAENLGIDNMLLISLNLIYSVA